jgi:hypothetical protein
MFVRIFWYRVIPKSHKSSLIPVNGYKILNGGTVREELYKPGEEPKEEPKPERKSNAWVPQMTNGEWEIY